MTELWLERLRIDPLPALFDWDDPALARQARVDLLGEGERDFGDLWFFPEAHRLVEKQLEDGAWKYAGKTIDPHTGTNYYLLETFRSLGILVETYRLDRRHPAIENAASFLYSCQTAEGDIRGILGNQYMPYYHGAILELLIKAGFGEDPRTLAGLDWLLSVRQDDGGWIVPAQAVPSGQRTSDFWLGEAVLPERSLPHAHLATGMVIRALTAHPMYRQRPETITAGQALKSRFFKPDKYNDRRSVSYWLKFQFPFWWANLLTALDSLSTLGFDLQDEQVQSGLSWFIENQDPDGLWPTGYGAGRKAEPSRRWVGLAVCRMLRSWLKR